MNLHEEINRMKKIMGLNESKSVKDMLIPASPKSPLHHYSTYLNRESILKNGLLPKIGRQTANYMSHHYKDVEPIPLVFAQDPRHGNYFGIYGNDVWEIDLKKANVVWYHDPIHKDDGNNWEFYVTTQPIPASAIKLISSNEQRDDDWEEYRKTGIMPNQPQEPEKPRDLEKEKEDEKYDEFLSKLNKIDGDHFISLDDLKK